MNYICAKNLQLFVCLIFQLAIPLYGFSQAWIAPKGTGLVSINYQYVSYPGHLSYLGVRFPVGSSLAQTAFFELEYSVTDKAALTVGLPFVSTRYTGTRPPPTRCGPAFDAHSLTDDGKWHSTVQDCGFNFRYNIFQQPFLLTPFIGAVLPTHDYEADGEAALGRHLRELHIGVNLGRQLDPILDNGYAHVRYAYAFVERPLGVPLDRSNLSLEVGYLVLNSLSFRGFASYQRTHGGFLRAECETELFQIHDRALRDNHWRAGGGVSFAFNNSFQIYGDYVTVLSGSSSHYGSGVGIGMGWAFGRIF